MKRTNKYHTIEASKANRTMVERGPIPLEQIHDSSLHCNKKGLK
jgi:hypothetical protein